MEGFSLGNIVDDPAFELPFSDRLLWTVTDSLICLEKLLSKEFFLNHSHVTHSRLPSFRLDSDLLLTESNFASILVYPRCKVEIALFLVM